MKTGEMNKQLQKKADSLCLAKEKLSRAGSFYVASCKGLTVADITELRKSLRQSNSEVKVFKNTTFSKAIKEEVYFKNFEPLLVEQNMITFAYGESSDTAKILFDFAKKSKNLEIKGCLFEGKFFGSDKIEIIKSLPSKLTLLSMLACVINEPVAQLARVLDALRVKKEQE